MDAISQIVDEIEEINNESAYDDGSHIGIEDVD